MYKVNLLPPELQKDVAVDLKRLQKIVLIALLIALVVGSYGFFLLQWRGVVKETELTQERIAQIQPLTARAEKLIKQRAENQHQVQELESLLKRRSILSGIINNIGHNVPVDVFFTRIKVDNETASDLLCGFASLSKIPDTQATQAAAKQNQAETPAPVAANTPPDMSLPPPNRITIEGLSQTTASVGVLINNLSNLPYFKVVRLLSIEENEDYPGYKSFKIDAYLIGAESNDGKP